MRVLRSIPELGTLRGPVVLSIGVFDGVHLGHRAVLEAAIGYAREVSGTAVALTFDPHPMRILRPDRAPRLLTSAAHKLRLIDAVGISDVLVLTFDTDFAALEAESFVRSLAGACDLRRICVGEGWVFGRGRKGDGELLRKLGAELGFTVAETPPILDEGGETISSTRIREAVEAGSLETARRLLGRDYTVLGTVEPGDALGRSIGFPTANLRAHNEQFPPDGVYAVRVAAGGRSWKGVANIGRRPTVGGRERRLEVHLLDFSGDLYGEDLSVAFVRFLRGERKFGGIDALRGQIASDVLRARTLLA